MSYATVTFIEWDNVSVRINAAPVAKADGATIFELSSQYGGLNYIVSGVKRGPYRHVAIDGNFIGYIYSMEEQRSIGEIGTCVVTTDE